METPTCSNAPVHAGVTVLVVRPHPDDESIATGGLLASYSARGVRVLIPGLLVYAALLASLTFLTHPVWLGLWSLAIGGAAGFVAPLPTALLGDQVSPEHHGVAVGWLRTMTDSGQVLGPLVMGALADAVHLSAPFLCAAALLMVTAWWCRHHASVISASP